MESQEEHRKTSDARRLIKYQKKGHKLSTPELELIERYREKERVRQQRFRKGRKLMCPFPKKRGRKPKVKPDKIGEAMPVESGSLHLADRIARRYEEEVPHQSVSSAVDILINGYRGICFVPIDSRFFAAHVNTQHTINSQPQNGEDSSRSPNVSLLLESLPADELAAELHRSTFRRSKVSSSSIDPTAPAASLSVSDVYSLAASGSSPTPSCTSSSSTASSSVLTVSSSQSPEFSAFTPQIGPLEKCQVGLNFHASTPATSGYGPNSYMGRSSGNYLVVTEPNPRSPKASHDALSHSIGTSSEIVQAAPKSLKMQQCELLPGHLRQLRGLLQAWSIEDKDRAFDEMVAFVNRVVEEVVSLRQPSTSSGATSMNSDDNVPLQQMPWEPISESQAYGEIHDILYEFTNFEQRIEHTY
ncbi:hypothetical protein V1523DRAFT_421828 [Lipomyces doorenjongii]